MQIRIPPTEPKWTEGDDAWTSLWQRVCRDLSGLPSNGAHIYYAGEHVEVWLWGRCKGNGGVLEHRVWLYPHDDEAEDGELYPMRGKPTRVWSRHLGVWVDLGHLDVLHIGGKSHAKNPASLQGTRVLPGVQLTPMDF